MPRYSPKMLYSIVLKWLTGLPLLLLSFFEMRLSFQNYIQLCYQRFYFSQYWINEITSSTLKTQLAMNSLKLIRVRSLVGCLIIMSYLAHLLQTIWLLFFSALMRRKKRSSSNSNGAYLIIVTVIAGTVYWSLKN